MDKLTQDDIRKAYESINNNEGTTWAKTLYTFEDGTDLCFVAAMMDFDGTGDYEPYAKLACIPYNSGMNDYEWDYVMPYKEGSGDVWDTETSFGSNEDPEWFNEQAEEIIQAVEDGEYITSGCHSKKKKGKKVVKSGNLPMKERAANREFEEQQKEWYSKPGTERAKAHHDDNIYTKEINFNADLDAYHMTNIPGNVGAEYLTYDLQFPEGDRGVLLRLDDFEDISGSVTENGDTDLDDTWRTMFTIFANMLCRKKWNGKNLVAVQEGDEIWIDSPTIDLAKWSPEELESYAYFLHDCIEDLAPKVWKQLAHKKSLQSSRKPVKSGRVTKDMWDEHLTELAIPKKDKIKYGLEEDDFFDEYSPSPETPPFELQEELEEGDDTVPFFNDVDERDDYYYSHVKSSRRPVKSAMPGREKGIRAIMDEYGCSWEEAEEIMNESIESSKKSVKSAMQISEIHNNTPNLYVRIVYCDCDYFSEYSYEETDEPIPLNEFKQMCKDFAETSNGEYMIQHDNDYQPAEYTIDFANWEAENEDEQVLGTIKFELLIDAGDELINYLEDDRYM